MHQGDAQLNLYTSWLATGFAVFLGAQRAIELLPAATVSANFVYNTMCTLAAGTCVLAFLANQTHEHGLGDGTSLLIAASFLSSATRL